MPNDTAKTTDQTTEGGSLFLRRNILQVIEQYGPGNLVPRYAAVYRGDSPVAVLAAQIVSVTGKHRRNEAVATKKAKPKSYLQRAIKPESYLPKLAAPLGDDFRCTVIRRGDTLLGFVTTVRDGSTAIAFYIGFDRDAAAEGLPSICACFTRRLAAASRGVARGCP